MLRVPVHGDGNQRAKTGLEIGHLGIHPVNVCARERRFPHWHRAGLYPGQPPEKARNDKIKPHSGWMDEVLANQGHRQMANPQTRTQELVVLSLTRAASVLIVPPHSL